MDALASLTNLFSEIRDLLYKDTRVRLFSKFPFNVSFMKNLTFLFNIGLTLQILVLTLHGLQVI